MPELFDVLPFVSIDKRRGRDCWAVKTTGDWNRDCRLGHAHAIAFLEYLGRERSLRAANDLVNIVFDMAAKKAEPRGAVAGFFSAIGEAATGLAAIPGSIETMRSVEAERQRRDDEALTCAAETIVARKASLEPASAKHGSQAKRKAAAPPGAAASPKKKAAARARASTSARRARR